MRESKTVSGHWHPHYVSSNNMHLRLQKTPLRNPALATAKAGLTAISWVDDHGVGGTQVCIFECAGLSVQGGKVSLSWGAAYGLSASAYVGYSNLPVQCRQSSSLGAGGYSKEWGNNIEVGPGGGISWGTNPDGSTNASDWEGDFGVGLGGNVSPGGQTTIASWDTSELWVNQ